MRIFEKRKKHYVMELNRKDSAEFNKCGKNRNNNT